MNTEVASSLTKPIIAGIKNKKAFLPICPCKTKVNAKPATSKIIPSTTIVIWKALDCTIFDVLMGSIMCTLHHDNTELIKDTCAASFCITSSNPGWIRSTRGSLVALPNFILSFLTKHIRRKSLTQASIN
ncbi:hypothetical protein [Chlamydia felis Fe/C-56]|uniref:Uncharacterized protein n=1 Tax=Chlamydia felis (strain Fe/C-56) TaxID=264202 RepID=Q253E6_CHLFF|nr:hypothetical protein [Chlamydia felis Fe/C-56]